VTLAAALFVAVPSGGVLGRHVACTNFTVNGPKDGGTYTNGSGFTVTVQIIRTIDVTFSGASLPVAHLWADDESTEPPTMRSYSPPVTEDKTALRGPQGSPITSIRFCYVAPAPTATPTLPPTLPPTPAPTAKPTLPPTPKPTLPPTPKPTATVAPTATPIPTDGPTTAPTASPTSTPSASPSPSASVSPAVAPPSVTAAPAAASPSATDSPSSLATPSPLPEPTPSPEPSPTPSPSPAPVARSFAASVPPPDDLLTDPAAVTQSLLLALLFLLLAAFPGQLINKTLEENYDEVAGWFARGGRAVAGVREALARFWKRRSGVLTFVALSAVLYGFLSPDFGPTFESVAALVGILAGLAVVIATFELPKKFVQTRILGDRGRLEVQPLTIFVAIACVFVSRVADFQPGYLYGLVAGWAFAAPLGARDEGKAAAWTAVWMLIVALGAWIALPIAEATFAGQPLVLTALAAGLATVFVGGLEGLLFELVPLRFLRGQALMAWRRGLWAVLFLAAGFAFAHILLTTTSGYLGSTRVSPLASAVILFVGFGIASVLFWGYFRFRPQPAGTAET
jgi:hypothetical protein